MKIFNLLLSLVLAWSLVIPSMAAIPKSPNLVTLNTFHQRVHLGEGDRKIM